MSLTVAIIKSHAILQGKANAIMQHVRPNFEIRAIASGTFEPAMLEEFYAEHKGKPYCADLMGSVSGPIVVMALEADDAVAKWRKMLGATNPRMAMAGTIRALYGDKNGPMAWNAAHGSDSDESAARELKIVFPNVIDWKA